MPLPDLTTPFNSFEKYLGSKTAAAKRAMKEAVTTEEANIEKQIEDAKRLYAVPDDLLRNELFVNDGWKRYAANPNVLDGTAIQRAAQFIKRQLDSKKNVDAKSAHRHIFAALMLLNLKQRIHVGATQGIIGAAIGAAEKQALFDKKLQRAALDEVQRLVHRKRPGDVLEFIVATKSVIGEATVAYVKERVRKAAARGVDENILVRFNNYPLADILYVFADTKECDVSYEMLEGVIQGAPWVRDKRVVLVLVESGRRYVYARRQWRL